MATLPLWLVLAISDVTLFFVSVARIWRRCRADSRAKLEQREKGWIEVRIRGASITLGTVHRSWEIVSSGFSLELPNGSFLYVHEGCRFRLFMHGASITKALITVPEGARFRAKYDDRRVADGPMREVVSLALDAQLELVPLDSTMAVPVPVETYELAWDNILIALGMLCFIVFICNGIENGLPNGSLIDSLGLLVIDLLIAVGLVSVQLVDDVILYDLFGRTSTKGP